MLPILASTWRTSCWNARKPGQRNLRWNLQNILKHFYWSPNDCIGSLTAEFIQFALLNVQKRKTLKSAHFLLNDFPSWVQGWNIPCLANLDLQYRYNLLQHLMLWLHRISCFPKPRTHHSDLSWVFSYFHLRKGIRWFYRVQSVIRLAFQKIENNVVPERRCVQTVVMRFVSKREPAGIVVRWAKLSLPTIKPEPWHNAAIRQNFSP